MTEIARAVISSSAAALLACGALASPALAALGFECDPPTCDFGGADTLEVVVTLDGTVTDLAGFSLDLEIESSVVRAVSVVPGELLGSCSWAFFTSMSTDTVRVDAAGLGCAISGPGHLAKVRIVGVSTGSSTFRCRGSILRDTSNASLPHDCPQENISYDAEVPVMPLTWTRLKWRYGS